MAIIVVGGSSQGAGKTALVCGLIAALPEFRWNAVKITARELDSRAPSSLRPVGFPPVGNPKEMTHRNRIWEETRPGEETDTARYLTAGAARSFLVVPPALGQPPEPHLQLLLDDLWPNFGRGSNFIFESNSVVHHVRPNVCLMIHAIPKRELPLPERKPSFVAAVGHADAMVSLADADELIPEGLSLPNQEPKPVFHLADLRKVSIELMGWLVPRLGLDSSPRSPSPRF